MPRSVIVGIHAIIVLLMTWLVSRKYKSALNPMTLFAGWFLVATVVYPDVLLQLRILRGREMAFDETILLSTLYFGTMGTAYLWRFSPLRPVLALADHSPFGMAMI